MKLAADSFPHVDAAQQECINDEHAAFFVQNGLLIIHNVLGAEELRALQQQTLALVARAAGERVQDPDFFYKEHALTGRQTPYRIEYVIERTHAGKALLGHPFILRTVEKIQGRSFIPTWDSLVFKLAGAGASIPWHRDAGSVDDPSLADFGTPIFNVDFYLDDSDASNCLWGIPGSNTWPVERARAAVERLNAGGFQTDGAAPLPMKAGDVILHNVRVLHGSPAAQSRLRRVIYYEFRPVEVERAHGPHVPEYIPLKQKVLLACLRHRTAAPYARGEKPFVYHPAAEFAAPPLHLNEELPTYRYEHGQYWRKEQR